MVNTMTKDLPKDFEPDDDFDNEHDPSDVGGPGGIVNTPKELWPEGFDPNAPGASPRVEV